MDRTGNSGFVLHHIENYREALSEIHRCLKADGYLVLIESVESNLLFRLGRTMFRRRDELLILSRYTYEEFVETLREVNFTLAREKRFYQDLRSFRRDHIVLARRGSGGVMPPVRTWSCQRSFTPSTVSDGSVRSSCNTT